MKAGLLWASLWLLNVADAVLTLLALDTGRAREANPLMEAVLSYGPWSFITLKIGLVSMCLVLLWRHRQCAMARLAVSFAVIVYLAVVLRCAYILWHVT